MTSEEIAEGVRAWLKEDVVKRNLTGEFSSKVTLIPLITALIITLITPNNPNNPNNGPNII
jgi:sulfur transfer complex TusBCD TusB component (DsrH family)